MGRMRSCHVMIIGGTGVGELLPGLGFRAAHIPTEFGLQRGFMGTFEGLDVCCVQRHSGGHKVPPHHVNYRAMAATAKALGVKAVLSTAAVGCLRAEWTPGTLVACKDFVDLTFRSVTMFDRAIGHADMSHGFAASKWIAEAGHLPHDGVYVGLDGPRYETPAEIEVLRRLGGDLVGMTATTEAEVIQECGIPYGCLAIVTNQAAGMHPGDLDHAHVVDVMKVKGKEALDILFRAAKLAAG